MIVLYIYIGYKVWKWMEDDSIKHRLALDKKYYGGNVYQRSLRKVGLEKLKELGLEGELETKSRWS